MVEQARDQVSRQLVERGILTREELEAMPSDRLDELLVRSGHELKQLPEHIPSQAVNKTRRMLGLGETGGREISLEQRRAQIEALVNEMRGYLERFRARQENLVGMVLCGSRMDERKIPADASDVDVVLLFKPGFTLDPSTSEGEELLYRLRDFSDNTPTDSGFPVELDEFYAQDKFVDGLLQADPKMLVWGWNPQATRYIGAPIGGKGEADVNERMRSLLKGESFETQRRQKVVEAARTLLSA